MLVKITRTKHFLDLLNKRKAGFSLLSVLVLGAVCSAFIAATATSLIPLYKEIGNLRSEAICNSGANSAIDFLLSQLNSVDRAKWDCQPGETRNIDLNSIDVSAIFPPGFKAWDSSFSTLRVAVSLGSDDVDLLNWAAGRADKGTDPSNSWRIGEVEQPPLKNWRVLTVEARYGGSHKNLRAVLRPRLISAIPGNSGNSALYLGGLAVTQQLLLGREDIEDRDTLVRSLAPKKADADVIAFSAPKINANTIEGNLKVFTQNAKDTGFLNYQTQINQAVFSNVAMSGAEDGRAYNLNTDGYDRIRNQAGNQASKAPHQVNSFTDRPTLVPAPESFADTSAIPSIGDNLSSLILKAGDYSGSGISVPSKTNIRLDNSMSGPARIFLSDTVVPPDVPPPTVVDIQGQVNVGGDPAALQIYYNGTGIINIRNSMNAMIYAPNATVLIGSGKSVDQAGNTLSYTNKVDFVGGIVARNLAGVSNNASQNSFKGVVGTNFYFDPALARADSSRAIAMGLTYNRQSDNTIWSSANLEVAQIVTVRK